MPTFETRSAKIIDRSSDRAWSQVHVFTPLNSRWLKRRGSVWAVFRLELGHGQELPLVELGRELITRFHEEYYGRLTEEVGPALISGLTKVSQELPAGVRFESVAVVLIGNQLVIGVNGEAEVRLCRAGRWAPIAVGEGAELNLFTGEVRADDWFVLGSYDFWEAASESVEATLSLVDFERVVEALSPVVFEHGQGAPAGILVMFKNAKESVKKPVLSKKGWSFIASFRRRRGGRRRLEYRQVGRQDKLRTRSRDQKKLWHWLMMVVLVLAMGFFLARRLWSQTNQRSTGLDEVLIELENTEKTAVTNPKLAREMVGQIQGRVTEADDITLNEAYARVLGIAWREIWLEELNLFFDLKLIEKEAVGVEMNLNGQDLVVLDYSRRLAYQIETSSGRGKPILFSDVDQEVVSLAGMGTDFFLLARKGVYKLGEPAPLIETSEDYRQLAVFADNFYLLEPASWEIYRYSLSEAGAGPRVRWLQEVVARAGRPLKMVIDGEIWVLDEEDQVFRLRRGVPVSFSLGSPREPLGQLIDLAVSEERLFVLAGSGDRLIIFDRDGGYLAQYRWPETKAEKLAVSADGKFVWLLAASRIYRLEVE